MWGKYIAGHELGKSYTTPAGSFPALWLTPAHVRICYPTSSVCNTGNPELHPFTYPSPRHGERRHKPWKGDGVQVPPRCLPVQSLGAGRGLAWLPRPLVTGNVKAFLTLTVVLSQALVTLFIMFFRSIHFLVWSACNSLFAAEQAVILLPAGQARSGMQRLSCPPETIRL